MTTPSSLWYPLPSAVSTPTLVALSGLSVPSPLPTGALVYVAAVDEMFVFLQDSTRVVDGTTVLTTAAGGDTRWVKTTIISGSPAGSGIPAADLQAGSAGQAFITRASLVQWVAGPGSGELPIAMANADVTLTAEQASYRMFKLTSVHTAQRALKFPKPASAAASYERIIDCRNVSGGFGTLVQLDDLSGTNVVVSDGLTQILCVTPSGVYNPVTGI